MFRAFSQFSAIDEGSVGTAILDEGEVARGSAIARQLEMDFRIGFVNCRLVFALNIMRLS